MIVLVVYLFCYTKKRATHGPLRWGVGALLGAPRSLPLRAPHPTGIPPRPLAVARRRTNGALCLVRERRPELHRQSLQRKRHPFARHGSLDGGIFTSLT